MRLPIKPNAWDLPPTLRRVLRTQEDPRILLRPDAEPSAFARAVSTLKFDRTFKSTARARFPRTLRELNRLAFAAPPVILDVGASDGSSSLDVMEAVRFRKYYCTDLNMETAVAVLGRWTYFYAPGGSAMLAACDRWVVYRDAAGALPPLRWICNRIFARAPGADPSRRTIELTNPLLRTRVGDDVEFRRYNALEPWAGEPVGLVIAANLLNRAYFTEPELERILGHLRGALGDEGWIVLIENRRSEQSSLIHISSASVRVHARVGRGAELEALALQALQGAVHA